MTAIVCLSSAPWQSIPTRTQQLMTRMKGVEVLFFEPPAPKGDGDYKKPGRRVRPGVTVYTLPTVWRAAPHQRWRFHHNQSKLGDFIQNVLRKHRIREPLLWCTTPENVHLLDFIPYGSLVYDCDRYWAGLPLTWESDLALGADVVFAASAGLVDRLTPCNQNVALVPNGCNYPMFTREDIEVPDCLRGIRGPVLGYAGTLWADLDFEPIFTCAAAHPDWWFSLLGRQEESAGLRRLKSMERVILADRHPLIEVPDFVRHWDVCLDLRRTGVASDVSSSRVFEYLAAGRPVVRHSFPGEVEELPGLVYQSDHPHGFAAACEQALREDGPWLQGRRRDAGEEAAWDNRAREVRRILETNVLL